MGRRHTRLGFPGAAKLPAHFRKYAPENSAAGAGDGFSKDSHWARGAAWAIYGFAISYGYTGDKKYLDASGRLAKKFSAQLNGEVVPLWDFRLPENEPPLRDASAAAVMACAIQEREKYRAADAALLQTKSALLERLCSEEYLDSNPACPGIQKDGQIGRAKNSYTSWSGYFLMEALSRELKLGATFW